MEIISIRIRNGRKYGVCFFFTFEHNKRNVYGYHLGTHYNDRIGNTFIYRIKEQRPSAATSPTNRNLHWVLDLITRIYIYVCEEKYKIRIIFVGIF